MERIEGREGLPVGRRPEVGGHLFVEEVEEEEKSDGKSSEAKKGT